MFTARAAAAAPWGARLPCGPRLHSCVPFTTGTGDRSGPAQSRSPGRAERRRSTSTASGISVDFSETRGAYKSKDSLELLRSLVVLKLCSYDVLVEKNKEIMDLGKMILGQKAFDQLLKMTFYGQFVAGEDQNAIKPLIEKNLAFGVGSVLDYSVEEDISSSKHEQKETT